MLTDITRQKIRKSINIVVLIISLALIAAISVVTFTDESMLDFRLYMHFQLFVCLVYLADYIAGICLAKRKWRFALRNIMLLIIAIPYSNIIAYMHIDLPAHMIYLLHFVPLLRATLALGIVVGYIFTNRIAGLFAAYMAIMLVVVYFSSIIFFSHEHLVNSSVTNYGMSLWWCALETTTIGAPFAPVTVIGKVLACLLSGVGIIMFPLFTVYLTNMVQKYLANTKSAGHNS